MRGASESHDLVVLLADLDMDQSIRGLIDRPTALGVRAIDYQVFRHPNRDAGCRATCHDFLRPSLNNFAHALVLFDRDGCGRDATAAKIEREVESCLARNGWGDRAAVIVLDPELEIWIWSDSPQIDEICGWGGRDPDLRTWLRERGHFGTNDSKPKDPKNAFRLALRQVSKQASPALFAKLARCVNFSHCTDRAFLKLKKTLAAWFPP